MSLSLSFHTNFVQICRDGQVHWAPRHSWQTLASEIFSDAPKGTPVAVGMSDLELELNPLSPTLTLVFPDGLEDWLLLQAGSFSGYQRDWLKTLLELSHRLPFSSWPPGDRPHPSSQASFHRQSPQSGDRPHSSPPTPAASHSGDRPHATAPVGNLYGDGPAPYADQTSTLEFLTGDGPTLWFFDPSSAAQVQLKDSLPLTEVLNVGDGPALWSASAEARSYFYEGMSHATLYVAPIRSGEDEVAVWTSAIAEVFLRERLAAETGQFWNDHPNLDPVTWTDQGPLSGLHSPLRGLPQALSLHLQTELGTEEGADNHLFLGWENFFFSYRDSIGVWRSHALPLQPFHSFKVDPHYALVPDLERKLQLPLSHSLNARPTLMDLCMSFEDFPVALSRHDHMQRLQDGLRTFFYLPGTQRSLEQIMKSALEEIYWLVEGQRTSEGCLVEGPLAELFLNTLSLPSSFIRKTGNQPLQEAHVLGNVSKGRT